MNFALTASPHQTTSLRSEWRKKWISIMFRSLKHDLYRLNQCVARCVSHWMLLESQAFERLSEVSEIFWFVQLSVLANGLVTLVRCWSFQIWKQFELFSLWWPAVSAFFDSKTSKQCRTSALFSSWVQEPIPNRPFWRLLVDHRAKARYQFLRN